MADLSYVGSLDSVSAPDPSREMGEVCRMFTMRIRPIATSLAPALGAVRALAQARGTRRLEASPWLVQQCPLDRSIQGQMFSTC